MALGKTAMPRADHPGFNRHHPRTSRCFLLFPHPSMMSDTAWMQYPTYSFTSSFTLSGDCIGANFWDSAFKGDAPGQPFHPTSSLDGPHISHGEMWRYLRRHPEVWCYCRALGLLSRSVSGSILDFLSELRKGGASFPEEKSPTCRSDPEPHHPCPWWEQAANTPLLTESGLDQRKAKIHGIAGGPWTSALLSSPSGAVGLPGIGKCGETSGPTGSVETPGTPQP